MPPNNAQPVDRSSSPEGLAAKARRLLQDDPAAAAVLANQAIRAFPNDAEAYRLLGRAFRALRLDEEAEGAELDAIAASISDPELIQAAQALNENQIPVAEAILRARLKQNPFDVAAIRMFAEVAARIGRFADAEKLLKRALELAPAFSAARANLATVLHRQHRSTEALEVLDGLLLEDPADPRVRSLKAAALGRIGSYEEAARLYSEVLDQQPNRPPIWMSYGHVLKTIGRTEEGIAAYRKAIELAPGFGEVWWSLANLKTFRFTDADIATMTEALGRHDLSDDDRLHLHFALGKAQEDAGDAAASFGHYAEGNRIRRATLGYDPNDVDRHVQRSEQLFTAQFFAERKSWGCPAPDPIFILGMPRAGSTLLEQILASHPMIEGTSELPDLPTIVRRLSRSDGKAGSAYPDCLAAMDEQAVAALGEEYLGAARVHRRTERPMFIDKMPNNWMQTGLILLTLPNAKIIDARRHPLDCCFSNFKQHFARGQGFTYSLEDLGRYYVAYVRLMRHFESLFPGRIYRVIHEHLLDAPEAEIRRILAYLELPFDPGCLRFHENERAVRTASSEQVRRPINRKGMNQWVPFAPWLQPLEDALGAVAERYPEVPGPAELQL